MRHPEAKLQYVRDFNRDCASVFATRSLCNRDISIAERQNFFLYIELGRRYRLLIVITKNVLFLVIFVCTCITIILLLLLLL